MYALTNDRAQVKAAVAARDYAQQSLDAEVKKLHLGASTTANVLQQQRSLAMAEDNLIAANAGVCQGPRGALPDAGFDFVALRHQSDRRSGRNDDHRAFGDRSSAGDAGQRAHDDSACDAGPERAASASDGAVAGFSAIPRPKIGTWGTQFWCLGEIGLWVGLG